MVGMLPSGKPAAVETKEIQNDIVAVYIKGKFKKNGFLGSPDKGTDMQV
jgi:hypothetical protein